MRKWQIKPVQSIGGASLRKLVFTGHDTYPWPAFVMRKSKKDSLLVSRIRCMVGRIIQYL